MPNPFIAGNPVPSDRFLDRRRELRRITGWIVNHGQSTAIVGEPRSGKTSLLHYLAVPEKRVSLYGAAGDRLVFSYLDAHMLGTQFSQAQFWECALRPIHEQMLVPNPDSSLAQAYQTCIENNFGAFVLERLLAQIALIGRRLVLMLDEFDVLLYYPLLNCAEFFGSLRSLASRCQGLVLCIASRRSLASLNDATLQFRRTGSPYFNFLDEITLGPFPNTATAELLRQGERRFTPGDRRFIVQAAGGHPYLLQAAASVLWELDEEGEDDPIRRWEELGQRLYEKAALTLGDTWNLWPAEMRMAFTAVALAQITLEHLEFDEKRLLRDVRNFGPELRSLARQGFVREDTNTPNASGWQVRPQAFLWWLTDQLVRTVRDENSFEEWIQGQQWEGLLKHGQKQQLGKAARAIVSFFKNGAATFIEAAAKGLGDALIKR